MEREGGEEEEYEVLTLRAVSRVALPGEEVDEEPSQREGVGGGGGEERGHPQHPPRPAAATPEREEGQRRDGRTGVAPEARAVGRRPSLLRLEGRHRVKVRTCERCESPRVQRVLVDRDLARKRPGPARVALRLPEEEDPRRGDDDHGDPGEDGEGCDRRKARPRPARSPDGRLACIGLGEEDPPDGPEDREDAGLHHDRRVAREPRETEKGSGLSGGQKGASAKGHVQAPDDPGNERVRVQPGRVLEVAGEGPRENVAARHDEAGPGRSREVPGEEEHSQPGHEPEEHDVKVEGRLRAAERGPDGQRQRREGAELGMGPVRRAPLDEGVPEQEPSRTGVVGDQHPRGSEEARGVPVGRVPTDEQREVGRERKESLGREGGEPFPSLSGEVGDENVAAEVQLRPVQHPPAAGAAAAAIERHAEIET